MNSYNGNILSLPPSSFIQSLDQAHQYMQRGEKKKALDICIKLLAQGANDEMALKALVQIYFSVEQVDKAVNCLLRLACLHKGDLSYCQQLENVCRRYNKMAKALSAYEYFVSNNPSNPIGFFNFALLLKKEGDFEKALDCYQKALLLNIELPEEVLVNMAIIHIENFEVDDALNKLERALTYNPMYIPALQNKASVLEGQGKLEQATKLYEAALALEPGNITSLSRLAFCYKHESNEIEKTSSLIAKSKELLDNPKLVNEKRESLLYAMGKVHDDIQNYAGAFHFYKQANYLSQSRVSKYIPIQVNEKFKQIKLEFTKEWFANLFSECDEEPIFIVGMFRSGSTLVEQILASHPSVTSGGELSYFPELANTIESKSIKMNDEFIRESVEQYLAIINTISAEQKVTDKRPDNFMFIGLIKNIFPKAKFIWTMRNKADICLSNYFLQLNSSMNYANDFSHLSHYYDQHIELYNHWMSIFPEDICLVNYDELIVNLKSEIMPVLKFIGEEWVDECEKFFLLKNHVQTASVWQVRQPLYKSSSGRANNYKSQIGNSLK